MAAAAAVLRALHGLRMPLRCLHARGKPRVLLRMNSAEAYNIGVGWAQPSPAADGPVRLGCSRRREFAADLLRSSTCRMDRRAAACAEDGRPTCSRSDNRETS